jgi:hypothetical protein
VGREIVARFGEVTIACVETFDSDPFKAAAGEGQHVMAFALANGLRHRAALRSKQGAGDLTDITRSLGALFGSRPPVGAVLGDPVFEQHYDVNVPSREEGVAALTMPLRHLLVGGQFRGAVEIRPGGVAIEFYGMRGFDPVRLDGALSLANQILAAAQSA